MENNIELVAPAGSLEKLKIAINYGANAVYLGGKEFGLRAFAGNFTLAEIEEGIKYAHARGARVYITINIFANNTDIERITPYLIKIAELKADALIISDPGILALTKEVVPEMPVHLSTQANTTNWRSARFWYEQGVKRVVLAREVPISEISTIKEKSGVEIEAFVHGAMCMAYSGRCWLSHHLVGRSANRGECAHPCRWKYSIVEEQRPGDYLPVEEDDRGSYILSPGDLCMIEFLPELIKAGVQSFKIEGRMKSVHYVATIVNAYRQALDKYLADPQNYSFSQDLLLELDKAEHRPFNTGFFFGQPEHVTENITKELHYIFAGVVKEYFPAENKALIEQRNKFSLEDELEFFGPDTKSFCMKNTYMTNEEGLEIKDAPHAQQLVYLYELPQAVKPYDLMRLIKRTPK